jgi:flagellar hook protein FlgE
VFTTAVQFFDALGAAHVGTVTYTKTASAGAWDYEITVPGKDVNGPDPLGAPVPPVVVASGTMSFTAEGLLDQVDGAAADDITISMPAWFNGAAAGDIEWDLVDTDGIASLTGYAATSATSSIRQNGSAPGMIDNISISADGTIVATFGAGQTVSVAQLALASFNNPKGLVKLGSSRLGESQSAGIPNVGVAGTGGRGTLIGSALEQSNVDIAQEFTQMILAQRGYQANSKTITVSDELLVETLNLKR